jgi:hypothetical protein
MSDQQEQIQEFPSVVELNVGGSLYTTRLSTLRKDPTSMLGVMFSGRHKVDKTSDGRFFIDRDGGLFKYILEYLRDEKLPPVSEAAIEVYQEACFYQIAGLTEILETYEIVQRVKKKDMLVTLVRDKLGEEYKLLLRKIIYLIEKKQSEFLEKCFDSQEEYNPESGRTTYEYQKVETYRQVNICVLEKDQARCTLCHMKMPIPTATRSASGYFLTGSHLPEVCLPASLPPSLVKDYILKDISGKGWCVSQSHTCQWNWTGSPHGEYPCTGQAVARVASSSGTIQRQPFPAHRRMWRNHANGYKTTPEGRKPTRSPPQSAMFEQGLNAFCIVVRLPLVEN